MPREPVRDLGVVLDNFRIDDFWYRIPDHGGLFASEWRRLRHERHIAYYCIDEVCSYYCPHPCEGMLEAFIERYPEGVYRR